MTTRRDDIAGLSERLRDCNTCGAYVQPTHWHSPDYDKGRELLNEAATALDALNEDNDQFRRIALDRLDKLTKAAHALGRIQRGDSDPVSIASDVLRLMPWTGSNE
jgi:hypothetical protein